MNRLSGELASAVSGVQTTQPASAPHETPNDAAAATRAAQQPKMEQKDNSSVVLSRETRLALVIGAGISYLAYSGPYYVDEALGQPQSWRSILGEACPQMFCIGFVPNLYSCVEDKLGSERSISVVTATR
jgi:hypothetical protein